MDTIQNAIKNFLTHCKLEKNLSQRTLKAYQIDLTQLLKFLKQKQYPLLVSEISKNQLRDYLESLSSLKPKSIKRKVATAKAMFNYLEYDDLITVNPFRKMRIRIKEDRNLPKVLSLQEITQIYGRAYNFQSYLQPSDKYSYFEAIRNIVVLELLFTTGGRVSEISNLRDENIDLISGVIRIKGKGNRERIIQICNPETIAVLKQYRKMIIDRIPTADNYFLINRLGKKLSDQSIRGIVKKLTSKTKIKIHVTPHVFRHSFATLLLEKDVDIKYIQAMLGHSSIVTTQIYTHVNKVKQRQILKTKHPRKELSFAIT
ncbi:MAG: integrase, partial [Bacteroidetes bacterium 46-16]